MAEKLNKKSIKAFLDRIVVNAGVGKISQQPNFESKILPMISKDISIITGYKPKMTSARKSIAGFKIRQGQVIGLKTTLRSDRMVDFFEKLIKIVLPRVRDFKGISLSSVDSGGCLNIGFRDQMVFPEINPEESQFLFSLGINIVPKTKSRDKAIEEYKNLGMPFKRR